MPMYSEKLKDSFAGISLRPNPAFSEYWEEFSDSRVFYRRIGKAAIQAIEGHRKEHARPLDPARPLVALTHPAMPYVTGQYDSSGPRAGILEEYERSVGRLLKACGTREEPGALQLMLFENPSGYARWSSRLMESGAARDAVFTAEYSGELREGMTMMPLAKRKVYIGGAYMGDEKLGGCLGTTTAILKREVGRENVVAIRGLALERDSPLGTWPSDDFTLRTLRLPSDSIVGLDDII